MVENQEIDNVSCRSSDYPDIAYETKEERLLIINLINGLKDDQKISLVLKHVQGFSYKEIADILGVTPEAAKMKVQRAKQIICRKYNELKGRGVYNEVHI